MDNVLLSVCRSSQCPDWPCYGRKVWDNSFFCCHLCLHCRDIPHCGEVILVSFFSRNFLKNAPFCIWCPLSTSRQTGIGVSSMFARMGGVLAPIINMLHNHSPAMPFIIFGTTPLLGAVLALALPETANRPLPDTLEDAENWDVRYVSFYQYRTLLFG